MTRLSLSIIAFILMLAVTPATPAGAVDGTEPISTFTTGLLNPRDIHITPSDVVYIADSGNNRIVRVENGVSSVVAGTNGASTVLTGLSNPRGVHAADDGTIWVADTGNGRVLRISGGAVTTLATGLSTPSGLVVINDTVYVVESGANRVVTVEEGAAPVVVVGDDNGTIVVTALTAPSKIIAVDAGFMVVDSEAARIVNIVNGSVVSQVGTGLPGSSPNEVNNPFGVAVGAEGIYVADTFNNSVRLFPTGSTDGQVISTAWADRMPIAATPSDRFTPIDVALDSDGSLYVVDFVFNWVIKLDASDLSPFETLAGRSDLDANHANILRLYWATFDREPDVSGGEFWINAFNTGSWPTLTRIAEHFVVSAEFVETYGDTSNAEFVDLLYQNVLGRPGETGGRTFWIGELDAERRTRGQVLADFSFSAEFRADHPLPSDDIAVRSDR